MLIVTILVWTFQVHANVSLKRIDSFMNNENLEDYVELIKAKDQQKNSNDEEEEDENVEEIAIECSDATLKWNKNQVLMSFHFEVCFGGK